MAKTLEELEKMFTSEQEKSSLFRKDMELKLESANKDVAQYKQLAEKREEELRVFKEQSEKDKKERETALAKARETEITVYAEDQVKQGRLLPAQKDSVIAFMKSLTSDTEVISFTEQEGSKRSHSQISLFKELFSKLGVQVPIKKEFTRSDRPMAQLPFAESKPLKQDDIEMVVLKEKGNETKKYPTAGAEFAAKIFEYQQDQQKLGKEVSYELAMIEVSRREGIDARIPS